MSMNEIFFNCCTRRKAGLLVLIPMLMLFPCSIKQGIKKQLSIPVAEYAIKGNSMCSVFNINKLQKTEFNNKVANTHLEVQYNSQSIDYRYNNTSIQNALSFLIKQDKIALFLYLCVLII